jgi:hypothetical protein
MPELYRPDLNEISSMSVITLNAEDVPSTLWRVIQNDQRQLVRSQIDDALPINIHPDQRAIKLERAFKITNGGDTNGYANRRINPNAFRGTNGTNDDQLYRHPRVTVVFDRNDEFAASVTTVRNTSGREGPMGFLERWVKMLSPPTLPKLGRHRYERISDIVYVNEPLAALAGIHAALQGMHENEMVAMYHIDDPADDETDLVIGDGGLWYKSTQEAVEVEGYGIVDMLRYEGTVGRIRENILNIAYAQTVINGLVQATGIPSRYQ